MTSYHALYSSLRDAKVDAWADLLPLQLASAFDVKKHSDLANWLLLIEALPVLSTEHRLLADTVQIGVANDINDECRKQLTQQLKSLHPWRKGPFSLFGIDIDTEWRSDWKWQRLERHIAPLDYRLVLDVGCGNGYHCWRMLGLGAKLVIGIDPMLLNVMQFQLIKKLYGVDAPIYVLPLGVEDVPFGLGVFDTVFSMGVLYHRRSPMDHLLELKACLRSGGELVLETLVIDGHSETVLVPESRYAKMRNVWFLPSCEALISWMKRCGFINIRLVDVTVTSLQEQRSTEWMRFHSLQDFLDSENQQLTCEGLPAPKRAIIIANTP